MGGSFRPSSFIKNPMPKTMLQKPWFLQRFLWVSDFKGLAVAKLCRKMIA